MANWHHLLKRAHPVDTAAITHIDTVLTQSSPTGIEVGDLGATFDLIDADVRKAHATLSESGKVVKGAIQGAQSLAEHTLANSAALTSAIHQVSGQVQDLSQALSGISAATYYPIAAGRRDPRMSTMVAISAAFGFELVLRHVAVH